MNQKNHLKPRGRLCVIDIESTLTTEGFEAWAEHLGDNDLRKKLKEITDLGQIGTIDFKESLRQRLEILGLDSKAIEQLGQLYIREMFEGARELIEWARENFERVTLVSGGLRPALELFVEAIGLDPAEDLYAIDYNPDEKQTEDTPLFRKLIENDGKRKVYEEISKGCPKKDDRPNVVIGDGKTDAAAAYLDRDYVEKDSEVTFIAVGGRESVILLADYYASDLKGVRRAMAAVLANERKRKQKKVVEIDEKPLVDASELRREIELETQEEGVPFLDEEVLQVALDKVNRIAHLIQKCEEDGIDIEGRENIEDALRYLSGGQYFSPRDLEKAFSKVPGINLRIPQEEMEYLDDLFPKKLTAAMISKIKRLKQVTEGEVKPVIGQIPRIIRVDGKKVFLNKSSSLSSLFLLKKKLARLEGYASDYIEIRNNGSLRAWTSGRLKGSTKKGGLEEQINLQNEILGTNAKVGVDFALAHILQYISHGRSPLPKTGSITLNQTKNNKPVNKSDGVIYLYLGNGTITGLTEASNQWNGKVEWKTSGIGASYVL